MKHGNKQKENDMSKQNEHTEQGAVVKASPLTALASRLTIDPNKLLQVMKATVIKGKATDEEVIAFTMVANTYKLNPLVREIYAFTSQQAGVVPIVGVDGWSKLVNSRPDFDGVEFSVTDDNDGKPISCTCTIHVKGRNHPVTVTEYWVECKRNTPQWSGMPRRMLRHKAFIQCARLAFGLAGIYDEDEGKDIIRSTAPEHDREPAPAATRAAEVLTRKRKTPEPAQKPAPELEPAQKQESAQDDAGDDLFEGGTEPHPEDDDDIPM